MSDNELKLALFEDYQREMNALDVDFRHPNDLADDDPRRSEVDEVLAKYGGIPTAPAPPDWEGRVPSAWDGSLESVRDCLREALNEKIADDIFVGEGIGLSDLKPVIGFADCALRYLRVPDVPKWYSYRIKTVPDALGQIEDVLRFVNTRLEEGWRPPFRTGIKGTRPKTEDRQHSRRSRSQSEVDRLVTGFIAEHEGLIEQAKAGHKRAQEQARNDLGRNAIARKLEIRSPCMVSKVPKWIEVADTLGIQHGPRLAGGTRLRKTGFDKALDEKSAADMDTAARVIQRETADHIRQLLAGEQHHEIADAIITQLETGQKTDDEAIQVAKAYLEQYRDDKSKKICGSQHA